MKMEKHQIGGLKSRKSIQQTTDYRIFRIFHKKSDVIICSYASYNVFQNKQIAGQIWKTYLWEENTDPKNGLPKLKKLKPLIKDAPKSRFHTHCPKGLAAKAFLTAVANGNYCALKSANIVNAPLPLITAVPKIAAAITKEHKMHTTKFLSCFSLIKIFP